jgi:glutamate--cysteine ligase
MANGYSSAPTCCRSKKYYSTIRPKRVIQTGERPIQALCARGVQYIEVRCMDVDPFEPVGISWPPAASSTPSCCSARWKKARHHAGTRRGYTENFARTVKEGRRPGLTLHNGEAEVPLPAWGAELLERIRPVAALLDAARRHAHADALAAQAAKLQDPELTPSAKVLAALRANGKSFGAFALAQSEQHAAYFRSHPPSAEEAAYFDNLAAVSLAEQAEMEAAPQIDFDDRRRLPRQQPVPVAPGL